MPSLFKQPHLDSDSFKNIFFSQEENKGDLIKIIKEKCGWSNHDWEHSKWISSWFLTIILLYHAHSFSSHATHAPQFTFENIFLSVMMFQNCLFALWSFLGTLEIILKMLFAYLYHCRLCAFLILVVFAVFLKHSRKAYIHTLSSDSVNWNYQIKAKHWW